MSLTWHWWKQVRPRVVRRFSDPKVFATGRKVLDLNLTNIGSRRHSHVLATKDYFQSPLISDGIDGHISHNKTRWVLGRAYIIISRTLLAVRESGRFLSHHWATDCAAIHATIVRSS